MTREEAIETIRRCCPKISDSECDFETAMRFLIPELRESEDERIRKAIVGLIEELKRSDKNFAGVELTDMLAYLEKQKEQKPLFKQIHDSIIWDSGLRTGIELGKQKEQKPSENVSKEEYVKRFKSLCGAYDIKLPNREYDIYHLCDDLSKLSIDSSKQNPAEWSEEDITFIDEIIGYFDGNELKHTVDEIIMYLSSLRHNIEYHLSSEKQQEWSEEEKRKLNRIYSIIGWAMDEHAFSSCKKLLGDKEGVELQDFLRSIAKPWQEWSEEDEKMRINILNALTPQLVYSVGKGTYTGTSTYKYDDEIRWLKNLSSDFKKRNEDVAKLCSNEWSEEDEEALDMCLDAIPKKWKTKSGILLTKWLKDNLRPRWKPSEEQMKALEECGECKRCIKELREQLKK